MSTKKLTYEHVKNYIEIESESECKLLSEEYKGNKSPLDLMCSCGNKFTANWVHIKYRNQTQCKECGMRNMIQYQPKTHETFVNEIKNMYGDEYTVLGVYLQAHKHIKMRHNICGYEWLVSPANLLYKKSQCPHCNGGTRKTQSEFISEVKQMYGDEYTVVGEYISYHKEIKIKHNICGNIYSSKPSIFLSAGVGCNICSESKGESKVRKFLESNNIEFTKEKFFYGLIGLGGNSLRFDFYLDDIDALIEYDGEFHYKKYFEEQNFDEIQIHDKRKDQYCIDNNIPLLRIPYWDFDNIEIIIEKYLKSFNLD